MKKLLVALTLEANEYGISAIACRDREHGQHPDLGITFADVYRTLFNTNTGAYVVLEPLWPTLPEE